MGRKNVNVVVGGPVQSDYPKVYNTVFIKPNIPFALQVTKPNTKYVIRHKIDLGSKGDKVSDVDFTNADTHEIADITYYYVPFTANGKPYTLLDDSCVFITSDWTGLSARTITPEAGTLFMIGSVTGGLHRSAYINAEVVTMPENCILEFDGGSISNGKLVLNDTLLIGTPVFDCELEGTVKNDELSVDIMKNAETDGHAVQQVFNLSVPRILFSNKTYSFSDVVIYGDNTEIIGNDTTIVPVKKQDTEQTRVNYLKNVFKATDVSIVKISGFSFISDIKDPTYVPELTISNITHDYSNPLIDMRNLDSFTITDCLFKDIEGNTYWAPDGHAGRSYAYKQGLMISLWDVGNTTIERIETTNCRFDEQIWCIASTQKTREDINVTFRNNYIHNQKPQYDSSAFTTVCNTVICKDNIVTDWEYKGSIFNLFGLNVIVENNTVSNSASTSVFDTCEYGYFDSESVIIKNNNVDCINSTMALADSSVFIVENNTFKGAILALIDNEPKFQKGQTPDYPYFADGERDHDLFCVKNNYADSTNYDVNKPHYSDTTYNVRVVVFAKPLNNLLIHGNVFKSRNNYPTVLANNTKNIKIQNNTFNNRTLAEQSSVVTTNVSLVHYNTAATYTEYDCLHIDCVQITDNFYAFNGANYGDAAFQIMSIDKPYYCQKAIIKNNKYIDNNIYNGNYGPYISNAFVDSIYTDRDIMPQSFLFGKVYCDTPSYKNNYEMLKNKNGMFVHSDKDNLGIVYADYCSEFERTVPASVYDIEAARIDNTPFEISTIGEQINIPDGGNTVVYKAILRTVPNEGLCYGEFRDNPDNNYFKDFYIKGDWSGDTFIPNPDGAEFKFECRFIRLFSLKPAIGQDRTLISNERPVLTSLDAGISMYDKTLRKPIWWDGAYWRDSNCDYLDTVFKQFDYEFKSGTSPDFIYTEDGLDRASLSDIGFEDGKKYIVETEFWKTIDDIKIKGDSSQTIRSIRIYQLDSNNAILAQGQEALDTIVTIAKLPDCAKFYMEIDAPSNVLGVIKVTIKELD